MFLAVLFCSTSLFAQERKVKVYKTTSAPNVDTKFLSHDPHCKDPLYTALFKRVDVKTSLKNDVESKDDAKSKQSFEQTLKLTAYDILCSKILQGNGLQR
jgi:hypothetical protein